MNISFLSNKIKTIRLGIFLGVFFVTFFGVAGSAQAASPVLNFSDLINGPKSGLNDGLGEGAIVTIWGNNLGESQGTSKVYFKDSNNAIYEAAHVYYWKNADGQLPGGPSDLYTSHKMQEIAFSIPSASADGAGKIYATVDGANSNELDFSVRSGNIYFITSTGTGNGSFASPFSPLNYTTRLATGEDGAIGYFRSGTYDGLYADTNSHNANFSMTAAHSGSIGHENAFVAYPGENALITASVGNIVTRHNFTGVYNASAFCHYIVVAKLNLYSDNQSIGSHTGWRIINNRVDSIHLVQASAGCIGTGGYIDATAHDIAIFGNEIAGGNSGSKYDHAIYPGSGVNYLDVGWNYIHDCNFNEGPLVSLNSNFAYDNNLISTQIVFHDNLLDSSGIATRMFGVFEVADGSDITYYNNVLICTPSATQLYALYAMSGNIKYYNNTAYNCGSPNLGGTFSFYEGVASGHTYAPESVELQNNIIYSSSNSSYYIRVTGNAPVPVQSNNLFYNIASVRGDDRYIDDATRIVADPLFTNATLSDFTLQENSPAINTGATVTEVTKDFLGIYRPQGSAYDIGAFEYVSSEADTTAPRSPSGLSVL